MAKPERYKSYAHQRETTRSSSGSLQLRPFTKCEFCLKGKNLFQEGASSFLNEQFLMVGKITLPHQMTSLESYYFITHVPNCVIVHVATPMNWTTAYEAGLHPCFPHATQSD